MRKLLAILSFFCLAFLAGGYHLLYHFRIAEAKQEMKDLLMSQRPGDLTQFAFTDAESASLEWEGSSEFWYGGNMYDVVRIVHTDGIIRIWCLSDEREAALVNNFLKTQRQSTQGPSGVLLKLLLANYLPVEPTALPLPIGTPKMAYPQLICFLHTERFSPPTPPPQAC